MDQSEPSESGPDRAWDKTESLFGFFDELLDLPGFPDYAPALNGLQVEGTRPVRHLAVAVDASQETIAAAVALDADALLVHHGLFWSGTAPLTGRLMRRVRPLIQAGVHLYSAHLPLDAHPEVGNAAVLTRTLGLEPTHPFGRYEDRHIGWALDADLPLAALSDRLVDALGGPVQVIAAGPSQVRRLAVVTGGGASFLGQAADAGIDTLVTGEASHQHYVDARELGINLVLGGHYRTETWGVRALAERAAARFGLAWSFIDRPSGL